MRGRTVIATPPGATIKEQLVDRAMSQKEFAARMALSEKHISRLINGEVQLTPAVAVRLEMVLGLPARFWNSLEAIYREKLAKAQAENSMAADLAMLNKFPYNEMAKQGWVEATRNRSRRVINLRQFFEVAQLELLTEPLLQGIAYRRLGAGERGGYARLAWVQQAKLAARNIPTAPVQLEKLQAALPALRKMSRLQPEAFCEPLGSSLAACGIALVLLPPLGGSSFHGATFYDGGKLVLGLTVSGKAADSFWFSLFHEFGHILLGHIPPASGSLAANERAADAFAWEALLPQAALATFTQGGDFGRPALARFAESMDVDQAIVVGRLKREGFLPSGRYHDLKPQYSGAGD